jgi:tetratricopeptide (TPR) repeat protein
LEQVIRKNPDHADALNYVGYTLADERRDLDRALVLVQSAQAGPGERLHDRLLAWVYFRDGQAARGLEPDPPGRDLEPEEPRTLAPYGDIAKALGKTGEARDGYKKALRFRPGNPRHQAEASIPMNPRRFLRLAVRGPCSPRRRSFSDWPGACRTRC